MYAHELRDCLLPLRSVSGPYDAEFMGKTVVVWIGQEYSPEVRRMVDSYAKDVPYYELPGWHHQRIWWEKGADPRDHDWPEWDFGYFQRRDQFFKQLGVVRLAGLRVRSMEVALHARRYSMGVMDRTRQAADFLPALPVALLVLLALLLRLGEVRVEQQEYRCAQPRQTYQPGRSASTKGRPRIAPESSNQ